MTTGPDRRQLLADAAIAVISGSGMRALTHRAVDAAAGVPSGTTSYHFRTRRELLRGVLTRIADGSAARLAPPAGTDATPTPAPTDRVGRLREAEVVAKRSAAFVDEQLTTHRATTIARMACEIEVASDPELREILQTGQRFRTMATATVGRLGSTDPSAHGAALIAFLEGLQFDRLIGTGSLHAAPPGTEAGRAEIADAIRTYLIGIIPG